jgi:hypothetical protein
MAGLFFQLQNREEGKSHENILEDIDFMLPTYEAIRWLQ